MVRIWFEKGCGDLGPPAGFPRLRIHKYGAVRGAPAFGPSWPRAARGWPCFFESGSAGTQIRPTLASAFSAAGGEARVQTLTASSVASATAFHHLLNWADAATNIQWAVNAATAGDTVLVSNGTYYLTNQINISAAITCASVNGKSVTIVDGNYPNYTNRCFEITAPATLSGFTVRNGYFFGTNGSIYGGGIYAHSSSLSTMVQDCRISDNTLSNSTTDLAYENYGGGISAVNAVVSNCEIVGNTLAASVIRGCGAYFGGNSTGVACMFTSNILIRGSDGDDSGQAVCLNSLSAGLNSSRILYHVSGIKTGISTVFIRRGTMRNTLVCNNKSLRGGVQTIYGAVIQNCTIVSNYGSTAGLPSGISIGCIYPYTTSLENVVCYLNTPGSGGESNFYASVGTTYTGYCSIVNSCIAPTSSFPTNVAGDYYSVNIESNPQFVNKDSNDFHLAQSSPCVNAGTNEDWMALDLDGHSRIDHFSRQVDMGCYEYLPQGMIISVP